MTDLLTCSVIPTRAKKQQKDTVTAPAVTKPAGLAGSLTWQGSHQKILLECLSSELGKPEP